MFWLEDNTISKNHERYGHRCYDMSIEGKICYDPSRGKKTEPHWCIIEIDKEITRYYRHMFKKRFGYELYAPAFDAHISVLKGMKTDKMEDHWKYLDGKIVEIQYDSHLYWNKKHVWLNTYCEQYFELRQYYDIPEWNTKDYGHLTVGKISP